MTAITFAVQGIPKAMSVGKTIAIRRGTFTQRFQTRNNTLWADAVGYTGRQHAPRAPFEGPVSVMFAFWLPRPQSAKKRVRTWPITRPDLDNLLHKLTDQWNGVFWNDDAQIVALSATKDYHQAGWTGLEVRIESVEPGALPLPLTTAWRVLPTIQERGLIPS